MAAGRQPTAEASPAPGGQLQRSPLRLQHRLHVQRLVLGLVGWRFPRAGASAGPLGTCSSRHLGRRGAVGDSETRRERKDDMGGESKLERSTTGSARPPGEPGHLPVVFWRSRELAWSCNRARQPHLRIPSIADRLGAFQFTFASIVNTRCGIPSLGAQPQSPLPALTRSRRARCLLRVSVRPTSPTAAKASV